MIEGLYIVLAVSVYLLLPITSVYPIALLGAGTTVIGRLLIIILFSAIAASLLVQRDPLDGARVGYGDDVAHYLKAFEQLKDTPILSFSEIQKVSLRETTSTEPAFWILATSAIHILCRPLLVWWFIALLSILFVSLPYINWPRQAAVVVCACYLSTITFYVLPGSGLRQGLAFGMLSVALVSSVSKRVLPCLCACALATLCHFSAFPLGVILTLAVYFSSKDSKPLLLLAPAAIFLLINSYESLTQTEMFFVIADKGSSYLEQEIQATARVQAYFELPIMCLAIWLTRKQLPREYIGAFLMFALSVIISLTFWESAGFARYYRYLYIFTLYLVAVLVASDPAEGVSWRRVTLVFGSFGWALFLILTRYGDLFVPGGVIAHLMFNPFYAGVFFTR